MPSYKAGVAGPIPLADGRVATAEQGEFEIEPLEGESELTPHDADLIERGVIVLAGDEPQAPVKSTPPAAPGVPADNGEKAGA
jgi:hypothetical protein